MAVVPNDVSLPIFSPRVWSLNWNMWRKCEKVLLSSVVEGFLLDFVEGFFIVRLKSQTVVNVANNAWRVVRSFVHMEWNVVRLVEWHVRAIRQIEGHIKEVYDLFVGFYCDFICLPKILQRSFLIWSVWRGQALVIPRPSSSTIQNSSRAHL